MGARWERTNKFLNRSGESMKLYNAQVSPFCARVRIALYHKGLAFEAIDPPAAGFKSPEYLAINPMGKLPVLVLSDGTVIPESEAILNYLEDAYPGVPLQPESAKDRAPMHIAIRVLENYVTAPTTRLFPHLDPTTRNAAIVSDALNQMREGLGYLSHYVADAVYACGSKLTLADCCVFPSLLLCRIIAGQFEVGDVLDGAPGLAGYFDKARSVAAIARVHKEFEEALAAYSH